MSLTLNSRGSCTEIAGSSCGWHLNGQTTVVQPLLTDLYQITMTYALWKSGIANQEAAFDLFFRRNPFGGEFTIFCGLEESLKYLENFKYTQSDIDYLRSVLPPTTEEGFFHFLTSLTPERVKLYAMAEGTVVFPRVPLLRIEGPLGITQLLETTLLNLINYPSLVATNATRFRLAAGDHSQLLEFGLRRAQGSDGGLSASKYCYIGGFNGTSNVLAGKLYGIPVKGTHAHAFVSSFTSVKSLQERTLVSRTTGEEVDFCGECMKKRDLVCDELHYLSSEASDGELAAFISYARAFPDGFLALVDTYDVLRSGIINFCSVALVLDELGYRAIGIRLDSGDLAYLSNRAKKIFTHLSHVWSKPWFRDVIIVASNDINEETLYSLNEQGHSINSYGIGTHLVTCQRQPALGCVYKLVEVCGEPKIKLSEDVEKVTIPGRKVGYRLYNETGKALVDIMQRVDEPAILPGQRVLCRHPFHESKRAYVTPASVQVLHKLYWNNGKIIEPLPSLNEIRDNVKKSLESLRSDIKRNLNPTPYKVSVSDELYTFLHTLWLHSAPIGELS